MAPSSFLTKQNSSALHPHYQQHDLLTTTTHKALRSMPNQLSNSSFFSETYVLFFVRRHKTMQNHMEITSKVILGSETLQFQTKLTFLISNPVHQDRKLRLKAKPSTRKLISCFSFYPSPCIDEWAKTFQNNKTKFWRSKTPIEGETLQNKYTSFDMQF